MVPVRFTVDSLALGLSSDNMITNKDSAMGPNEYSIYL